MNYSKGAQDRKPTLTPASACVVSGIRTTGYLHLGNYYGALKNWLALQDQNKYHCYFFAADWHALTSQYPNPADIAKHTQEMLVDWLAAGLDPKKCTLFVQSQVPEQAELHLLLSMIVPLGWLERVPTYKDQKAQLGENTLSTYGFLGYPVLQSADVLAYQANFVPVGEDQVAHLEITREIARRFNYLYGKKFTLPEPQPLLSQIPKMSGLDGRKMSKSYGNTLGLRDSAKEIETKIKKMPTSPARIKRTDPGEPTECPVFALHEIYASDAQKDWIVTECRTAGIGCLECKQVLIQALEAEIAPIRERALGYAKDRHLVKEIVQAGAQKARMLAKETLGAVKEAMGVFSC